ncbi:hypothetical protein L209DRAFT_753093, partial [Thermothelomyces heterothallicus CBS 203.75]
MAGSRSGLGSACALFGSRSSVLWYFGRGAMLADLREKRKRNSAARSPPGSINIFSPFYPRGNSDEETKIGGASVVQSPKGSSNNCVSRLL